VGGRAELLEMIAEHPGLSIPQAAKELGIAPGGLYGVARKLEAEGLIRKEGTGWHPAS
jgi:DNA-binding IclR family transcriptional regulator